MFYSNVLVIWVWGLDAFFITPPHPNLLKELGSNIENPEKLEKEPWLFSCIC